MLSSLPSPFYKWSFCDPKELALKEEGGVAVLTNAKVGIFFLPQNSVWVCSLFIACNTNWCSSSVHAFLSAGY